MACSESLEKAPAFAQLFSKLSASSDSKVIREIGRSDIPANRFGRLPMLAGRRFGHRHVAKL
jgi:hypothetical protein